MATEFNIHNRPKRSIHSRKLVITEELAELIGKDYNSESDEEFVPDKVLKKSNKNNNNTNDSNDNDNSDQDESLDEDNESLVDSTDSNENCNDDEVFDSKNEKIKNKLNLGPSSSKKNEKNKKNDKTKKQKRKYNKRKNLLHQLKVDEDKNENKKILEKLSSRMKPSVVASSVNKTSAINCGPIVKQDRKLINHKLYPIYIVSSNRNAAVDSNNIENIDVVKIPREKVPPISDPTGQWLCKLCLNRPNHQNLGNDAYSVFYFQIFILVRN